jgi:prepilin-type N-terminal cleavage/methylation domain-containing protein
MNHPTSTSRDARCSSLAHRPGALCVARLTQRHSSGFTLIELLVVIAVIAILAALIIPITGALKKARLRSVAQAELAQLETAIEAYKAKNGFYPPDAVRPEINQLYFELMGTTLANGMVETLDGSARIQAAAIPTTFGTGVQGFMNYSPNPRSDDGPVVTSFLRGLKPLQVAALDENSPQVKVLVCSAGWERGHAYQPLPSPPAKEPGLNPWRYVSSDPTNNPTSYDLWVDLLINNKTNRVSNWSKKPQVIQ